MKYVSFRAIALYRIKYRGTMATREAWYKIGDGDWHPLRPSIRLQLILDMALTLAKLQADE